MPTPRKAEIIETLTEKMRSAAAIYFTDYRGLSAPKATELRARLREKNIEFTVVKKTLSRLAAQEAGVGEIDDFMHGQIALAFSYDDPAEPAKVLREFSKNNQDVPAITGLILEGTLVPAGQAKELASLPNKPVLLGQLTTALLEPMSRLSYTLAGGMAKLVQVLSMIKEEKTS
ncbi:MAG: 50S ribosomal protein L10 [Fidelibacterota bacterium]|nr:MAG: 50S ribosomal protein L10 [Candidatus Neomarinimicrobiota bacterium]